MNEHSGNEGMFAAKLDDLQVPDLQDAIWDRISAMLDEVPADAGSPRQSGNGNINPNRMTMWRGIAGISIAVISIIFIERNAGKVKEQERQMPPTHQEVPIDSAGTVPLSLPDSNNIKSVNFNGRRVNADVNDSLSDHAPQPRIPSGPDIRNSSRSFRTGSQFADSISILPADTIGRINNSRGIKGLSDSSYRIVPGKKG